MRRTQVCSSLTQVPSSRFGRCTFPRVLPKGAPLAFGVGTAAVAEPALGVAHGPPGHVLHQLAVGLRPLLPAGRVGADVGIAGKVENGREQP